MTCTIVTLNYTIYNDMYSIGVTILNNIIIEFKNLNSYIYEK